MIYICKPHVIKFITSLILFIQIFVYYLLKVSLITFIIASFVSFFFFWVIKFVIALAFFFPKKKNILQIKKNGLLL